MRRAVLTLALLALVAPAAPARACTPLSTLTATSDALNKTSFGGTAVGGLSVLARTGPGQALALEDNDGATPARFYDLSLQPGGSGIAAAVTRVTTLAGVTGANADDEGLAVEPDGSLLVSSETEPTIRHFARNGTALGSLPVPGRFRVAPAGQASANRTLEGLSLSPSGHRLLAAMEGALSTDPNGADGRPRLRMLSYASNGAGGFGAPKQVAYTAESGHGVSDVLALDDTTVLVLERSLNVDVNFAVRIFVADLSAATDVTGVAALNGTQAVPKRLLFDLRACPGGLAALDNVEGVTLGPPYADGRQRLYLISDDNFSSFQHTRLYDVAFRLSAPPQPPTPPKPARPKPVVRQAGRWTLNLRTRRLASPRFRNVSTRRRAIKIRADLRRRRFGPKK